MNVCVWVTNDLLAASGTDSQWLPLINSTELGLATEKSFPRPKTSLTRRDRTAIIKGMERERGRGRWSEREWSVSKEREGEQEKCFDVES